MAQSQAWLWLRIATNFQFVKKKNQYVWSTINWGMLVFTKCSKWLNCLSRTHLISCLCGHRPYLPSFLASVRFSSWIHEVIPLQLVFSAKERTNFTNGCHVVSLLFCLILFKVEESLTVLTGSSRASLLTQFSVLPLYISEHFFLKEKF